LLRNLPQATVASDREVLAFIEKRQLSGRGIGYVDAQLLAATLLTPGAGLWTRDKRLAETAAQLGIARKAP
jgi:predicted nucleic acid-binding protein